MNKRFFYLILSASLATPLCAQQAIEHDMLSSFLKPIKCTKSGLRCFMRHSFNHPLYAREFLPLSFVHITDLLEFGRSLPQPRSYLESVFALFHERFQEARYANPYAVHDLLMRLPELIGPHFQDTTPEIKQALAAHLTTSLKERFSELKKNPDLVLKELADELYTISHEKHDLSREETQATLLRFFDQLIHKIIFDPHEQADAWLILRQLIDDIVTLTDYDIIPSKKSANSLIWGLLYRFGYFIECAGSEIKPDQYALMKENLNKALPEALLFDEQEELLTPKLSYIHTVLGEGLAKSLAKEKGILTDTIIT